jgi:hypothetical protein
MRKELLDIVELSLNESWQDLPAKMSGRYILKHINSMVGKELRATVMMLPLVLRSLHYQDGTDRLDLRICETIAEVSV